MRRAVVKGAGRPLAVEAPPDLSAGMIVSMGFCTAPDPVIPAAATWKQVTREFSFAYDLAEFAHCADVLDRGQVVPRRMISETIGVAELPQTLEDMRASAPKTKVQVDSWRP